MTSDCKTAILKGTAVCSLRCHLGMLQIIFKRASCHLTQKATPLHISQALKQHSQMLLELTPDVFIQPTFICVLPLHCFLLCRRQSLIPLNHRLFLPFWGSLCSIKHICLDFTGEISWPEGPEWCTLYYRCKPYIWGRRLFNLIETRSSQGKNRCQAKMILSAYESNLPFLKALD